jgi:DNA-binding NtrC family response regulator
MPARIVVVHDDDSFLSDVVRILQSAGYDVAGFSETTAALCALEAAERIEILITSIAFPEGMPHGVALARMTRTKRRGVKVLFIARPEVIEHAEGVGEIFVMPVTAEAVLAKVSEMLAKTNGAVEHPPADG